MFAGVDSEYTPKGFVVFFLEAASLRWPHRPDLCVGVGRPFPIFHFLKAGKRQQQHRRTLFGEGACQGLKSEDAQGPGRNPFTSYKPEKAEQHFLRDEATVGLHWVGG